MVHWRMKMLHALVALLIVLPLCSCATGPRPLNAVEKAVVDWANDNQALNRKIDAHNAEWVKLEDREKSLLAQMSNEQLRAYVEPGFLQNRHP
jgi:septal ring factor EnvC (AmiA/AmiB activator)